MNEPLAIPPVPQDLLCLRCRYALKGSARDDVCPECALPVADSLARPGLTNAPIAVLARLRRWSMVLAGSAGALFVLSIALIYAIIASISFFVGTSSPLANTLMIVLPSAMLVALIAASVGAVRAAAALHDAGCCSSRAPRMILGGSVLLTGGWALSIVEQFTNAEILSVWLLGTSIWVGGAMVTVCWAQSQRLAARSLGGRARRTFALLQLVIACAIAFAGGVAMFGVFVALPYLPGGYAIYSLCQNSLPYLILAILLMTAINALVLSISTRRLINARRAA
ncbi:MAG: hypothetical protein QM783_06490 [Phycisphaerales bacterium]